MATAKTKAKKEVRAVLDKELFCLPPAKGKFLVYAPLRRAAFVPNAAAVELVEFLRRLEIADAPEAKLHLPDRALPLNKKITLTTQAT
jgi:hypothetical protein